VQTERAELRPEINRKLVGLVDLGGAGRDLVIREIMHSLAQRIRGLAEIEIEHPVRIGNHDGRPPAKSDFVSNYALILEPHLVTGDKGEEGIVCGMPWQLNAKSVKTVSCPKLRKGM
jgi:hypothetical protein